MPADIPEAPKDPVAKFEDFFKTYENPAKFFVYHKKIIEMQMKGERSLDIDYNDLMLYEPGLAKELTENPKEYIKKASQAMTNILHENENTKNVKLTDIYFARFYNMKAYCQIPLREIRAAHVATMISVSGIIIRSTKPLPEVMVASFQCAICDADHEVEQFTDDLIYPSICNVGGCKNTKKSEFRLLEKKTKWVDWQQIRIQERMEESKSSAIPRHLDCILTDDIVDKFRPGERVTLTGQLRAIMEKKQGSTARIMQYQLVVNHIESEVADPEQLEITDEDEKIIKDLAKEKDIHERIPRSIAPEIKGMEHVKEGFGLALFGGVTKTMKSGHRMRGDIHEFVAGDPSTGKSQILAATIRLLPGSYKASGQGSTAAGLTAAVLKDEFTGNMTLEAGALVLADGHICGIDEFDKMKLADQTVIHEQMEQQTISINKAGISAQLNARTTILALSNPKLGRYDKNLTITENIKLSPPLLTRFDLLFIVTDEPNEKIDAEIADQIVALHMNEEDLTDEEKKSIVAPIEPSLLRKYIQYARRECFPKIPREIKSIISEYYVKARKKINPNDPIGMVARSLEGILRMCQARAKQALRDKVTEEDVQAVFKLYEESMKQVAYDQETQTFDVDQIQSGKKTSKINKMKKLYDIIKNLQEEIKNEPVDSKDIIERAQFAPLGFKEDETLDLLEQLKKEVMIIEKKSGHYLIVKSKSK